MITRHHLKGCRHPQTTTRAEASAGGCECCNTATCRDIFLTRHHLKGVQKKSFKKRLLSASGGCREGTDPPCTFYCKHRQARQPFLLGAPVLRAQISKIALRGKDPPPLETVCSPYIHFPSPRIHPGENPVATGMMPASPLPLVRTSCFLSRISVLIKVGR